MQELEEIENYGLVQLQRVNLYPYIRPLFLDNSRNIKIMGGRMIGNTTHGGWKVYNSENIEFYNSSTHNVNAPFGGECNKYINVHDIVGNASTYWEGEAVDSNGNDEYLTITNINWYGGNYDVDEVIDVGNAKFVSVKNIYANYSYKIISLKRSFGDMRYGTCEDTAPTTNLATNLTCVNCNKSSMVTADYSYLLLNITNNADYFTEEDQSTNKIFELRLNENSGTTAYDSSINNVVGIISGDITWQNNGILVNITNETDYTYDRVSGILNITNNNYFYTNLILDYNDTQSPTITIQSPISGSTYDTTTIYFNLTLDEEGDTCIYSLNNFATNYSMTKQGWVQEFKANKNILIDNSLGTATVKFICNDTSNNFNNSYVNFAITNNASNQVYVSSDSTTDYLTHKIREIHITNSGSNSVNNITYLTNFECPNSYLYSPDSESSNNPEFTCQNGLMSVVLNKVNPSNSSNILYLTYTLSRPPPTSSSNFVQNNSNTTIPSATDIVNKVTDTAKNLIDKVTDIAKDSWNKFKGIENRNIILIVTGIIVFLVIFVVIIVAIVHQNNPKKEE